MASKAKGKGKNAKIDLDASRRGTKKYEGALDNSFYVLAQQKDGSWHKARIIDCRLAKDYDSKKKNNDASYEYYVHYNDFNRRMDEWVTRQRIQQTDEKVQVDEHAPKKNTKGRKEERKGKGVDKEHPENDEHEGMDEQSLLEHQEVTKFKTIDWIEIGKHRCETWYYSPYPTEYHNIECLYYCEYCLAFFKVKTELQRHQVKCPLTHPPGDEIYRDDSREISISMYEVDGLRNSMYCENLCYLSKLFLDHKNLYWNMDPFLFFILCENDENGSHIVGYFSKEKESSQGWNLSCILTLPCYQRKGYGKFLISFSYELSKIDGKFGTPERPLSDLGKQTYLSWWTQRLVDFIKEKGSNSNFSINEIIQETGMKDSDILWTMEQIKMIKYSQGQISINTDPEFLATCYKSQGRPGLPVYADQIHWIPFRLKWDKELPYNFPELKLLNEI